jgi:hypothetical protein
MRQLHEHRPSRHSFITGNVVRFSKRVPPRNAAPGPYKVVAQLPERDGQFQYRVKSACEPFYRTVTENELESDVGTTGPPPPPLSPGARQATAGLLSAGSFLIPGALGFRTIGADSTHDRMGVPGVGFSRGVIGHRHLVLWWRRVGIACMLQRVGVHRADEGDDPPEVVAGLDDGAEGRHRPNHDLVLDAGVALLLQRVGAKRDEAEQRVIASAIDPDVVG